MKHLTMLALGGLLSCSVQAANWVEITSNADGGIKQYLDIDRIERNLGLVELWRVFDYQIPYQRKVDNRSYASQLMHTEFDCPSRAMRQTYVAWHAESMGKGNVLEEVNEPNVWQIDSFDESTRPLWTIACGEFDR